MFIGFAQGGGEFCAGRQQGGGRSAVQGGRGECVPVAQTRWADTQAPWSENRP